VLGLIALHIVALLVWMLLLWRTSKTSAKSNIKQH
jgi:hypothetical protein